MADNLDLILGGFQQGAKALQPAVDRQYAEQDRSQPLSAYERALGLVLSGKLSPKEAAIRTKLNLPLGDEGDGFGAQQSLGQQPAGPSNQPYPSQPEPSYGYSPGAGSQQPSPMMSVPQSRGPEPLPTPQQSYSGPPTPRPLGSAGYPSYPQPSQGIAGPQTRGDMQALMSAAPFMRTAAQDSSDDKLQRLMLTLASREKVSGEGNETKKRGQDVRATTAAAQLTESARQADDKVQLGYDALANRLEGITARLRGAEKLRNMGRAENLELAAIKLRHAGLLRKQSNLATLLNGIANVADNPRALGAIEDLKSQIDEEAGGLEQDLANLQSKGTTRGLQPGGSVAPVPEGNPDAPINGAPVLPTSTAVREPQVSVSGGGSTTRPGAGKIRVKDRNGVVGRVSPDNPGLKDGTYTPF